MKNVTFILQSDKKVSIFQIKLKRQQYVYTRTYLHIYEEIYNALQKLIIKI